MRVLVQYLLRQYCQTIKTLAHVGCTASKVNAHRRRWRDHRESTANTRASASASTAASTVSLILDGRSILIRPGCAGFTAARSIGPVSSETSAKAGAASARLDGVMPSS